MLKQHHETITRQAIGHYFGSRPLQAIIAANLGQDALRGQIGHPEYHFDDNAFAQAQAYIERQRALIRPALEDEDAPAAWRAFGRLTHAAQDFYAHSNYISLWLARFDSASPPPPDEVDALDRSLIASPQLRSGKLYYPLEALSFVSFLRPWALRRLPRDAHAWMNLDSPARGPQFDYAFHAAIKRTQHEFAQVLTPEQFIAFTET